MRVTSDFFVSALVRRIFSAGSFAAILRRGSGEAGAIFLIARDRNGNARLYGPADQTAYATDNPDDRVFSMLVEGAEGDIENRLEKERRFDSDIWVVEVEMDAVSLETLVTVTKP